MKILVIFLLYLGHIWCWTSTVTIKQGTLAGIELESRGGKKFHSFLGIPYAKPPEGELRFKAPQPHPGWQGVLDASKEGDMCVQDMTLIPHLSGVLFGKENCLFINVHSPIQRYSSGSNKLPVMVWIYGGAFQMGDSGNQTYGPTFLMDRDVIYVNFNYRLGVLGFLSFQSTAVPGNNGLKDQQLALQWVKDNIDAFGGDPESITIFGESAGAASVHYQLVSPKSQGLFHKAIMQSGSSFCPWALVPQRFAKDRANAFASLLGCHGNDEEKVACLRNVPIDTILATQLKFVEWATDPLIGFAPVIEPEHPGAFISKHPLEYQTSPDIPLVIGVNQDEGAIRTARLCSNDLLQLNQLNDRWDRYITVAMLLRETVEMKHLTEVVKAVTEYYLNGSKVDETNIRSLSDMYSDLQINQGTIKTAEGYTGPVYFYLYNYLSKVTWSSVFGDCSIPLGVSHGDEMVNLFNLDSLFKDHNLEGKDLEMSETILSLWTNFAATGVPKDDKGNIQWPQFGSSKQYLALDQSEIHIKEKPFEERYQFIESLPIKLQDLEPSQQKKTLGSKTEL